MIPARPLQGIELGAELADIGPRGLEKLFSFRARLAKDQLRLAIGLLARFGAQLLRGDERIIEGLVALTKRAQLFVKSLGLRLEFLVHARQPLQLIRDLVAELVHARLVVSAQRRPEVEAPRVHRCQMEGLVVHQVLAPNRTVPRRTIVAPSSTAIS